MQLLFELLRQRTCQLYHFSRAGMNEPQPHRVETLSCQTGNSLFTAIYRIA